MFDLLHLSKRARIVLIVLFGLIVLVVSGSTCGGSNTANTGTLTNASTPVHTPTTSTSNVPDHFKVGDQVKVGDIWMVTVNSAKTNRGSQYLKPKQGNIYVVLDVSLKNISSQEQNVSSAIQFSLQDATGQKYSETFTDFAKPPPDGKVEAGSPIRGQFVYEVPTSLHQFTFSFEADITSSGQTIWDIKV